MRTRRIFILSPHTLLARGVERLLHGQRGLRVVGTETDSQQGMKHIGLLRPDVVILGNEIGAPPVSSRGLGRLRGQSRHRRHRALRR